VLSQARAAAEKSRSGPSVQSVPAQIESARQTKSRACKALLACTIAAIRDRLVWVSTDIPGQQAILGLVRDRTDRVSPYS
jgi:hypothetical protein